MTEFEQRRRRVSSSLAEHKIEALLVSSPANVRYLTGYSGSNGLVLVMPLESHFFTDPRYELDAKQNIDCRVHVAKKELIEAAAGVVKRKRIRKLGIESAWLTVEQYEKLTKAFGSKVHLEPSGGMVEDLRAVKSSGEIDQIRKSVNANSEAYYRTLRRVRLGVREREIAAELEYQMRFLGAEKAAFDTIVASGARTALPHAQPTDRRIEENELLLVDMGIFLKGYASDMTRMSFLGVPSRKIRAVYRAVHEAQLAALDTVRAGVSVLRVDAAAREVLKKHELEREFVHSTGHGLGLEIHEAPKIGKKGKGKLRAGMVITIEPGVYLSGVGGVRIEDTVLVTENGCEILTPTTKELVNL